MTNAALHTIRSAGQEFNYEPLTFVVAKQFDSLWRENCALKGLVVNLSKENATLREQLDASKNESSFARKSTPLKRPFKTRQPKILSCAAKMG